MQYCVQVSHPEPEKIRGENILLWKKMLKLRGLIGGNYQFTIKGLNACERMPNSVCCGSY